MKKIAKERILDIIEYHGCFKFSRTERQRAGCLETAAYAELCLNLHAKKVLEIHHLLNRQPIRFYSCGLGVEREWWPLISPQSRQVSKESTLAHVFLMR